MLPPSGAKRLRKMILPDMPGGRAPPGSGLGAKPPYARVTIAILVYLGDYRGSVSRTWFGLADLNFDSSSKIHILFLRAYA